MKSTFLTDYRNENTTGLVQIVHTLRKTLTKTKTPWRTIRGRKIFQLQKRDKNIKSRDFNFKRAIEFAILFQKMVLKIL